MPSEPYLDFSNRLITAHLTSCTTIRLNQWDAMQLYRLLDAHYKKNLSLNKGDWNGAVAVIEGGWPRIVEQVGSYTCAIARAEAIHESRNVPTIAYALVDAHGIAHEDTRELEEEYIDSDVCGRMDGSRRYITLEDFA